MTRITLARTALALTALTMMAPGILAGPMAAQTAWQPLRPTVESQPRRQPAPGLSSGTRGTLRALDKMSGQVEDLPLAVGQTVPFGRLSVTLQSCRFPTENPSSDAYMFLEIRDAARNERLFRGWMIASSPALSALDHPRYDIWAVRCTADGA
jgi:hypothetical protein